jgi:thioesterase domain-containing protein
LVRRGDRPACVMLPGGGGGFNPYLRLAAHIGETHNVYVVRAAGLVPGEAHEASVEEMAEAAIEALDAATIAPALVFGWSMGGAIGWEICVRLADRGELPELVLVDASPLPRESTAAGDDRLRALVIRTLGPHAATTTVDLVRRTFDAQLGALAAYRAQRPYAGRVLMLMCQDDEFPGRATAAARWSELASNLESGQLAADHFGVFDPVHLPQLTDQIANFLDTTTKKARC